MIATRPAGNFARSFSAAGIVPVSHERHDLLLERAADPLELGRAALARERRDRHGRFAHGFRRAAVGEHAVDDRAVELVQVAELLERLGDLRRLRAPCGITRP